MLWNSLLLGFYCFINQLQDVKTINLHQEVKVFSEVIFIRLSLSGLFDHYSQFSCPTEQRNHSVSESKPPARANRKEYLQNQ